MRNEQKQEGHLVLSLIHIQFHVPLHTNLRFWPPESLDWNNINLEVYGNRPPTPPLSHHYHSLLVRAKLWLRRGWSVTPKLQLIPKFANEYGCFLVLRKPLLIRVFDQVVLEWYC